MSDNPYADLPANRFWRQAVADRSLFDIDLAWDPKFTIGRKMRISTFGSCFAQHFGRALKARDMGWFDAEPINPVISDETCQAYGYRVFSARTANIYTTSLLNQWTRWALGHETPPGEIWEKNGRLIDPFRPRIEPDGFASPEELLALRDVTLRAFRDCIEKSDIFVFTLGLTESWFNADGYEYPMCPGTVAGSFDPDRHRFVNQGFNQVRQALAQAIQAMRAVNPDLRFLLTVSPVPLTATNAGQHVVTATMESKSILRAVAGEIARNRAFADYFPSYEIINSPAFRGVFFEPNMRSVNPRGVAFVMETFFTALERKFGLVTETRAPRRPSQDDLHCEEAMLEAFG